MAPLAGTALRVESLCKSFAALGGAPAKSVIDGLSLELGEGERLAVIGPSGCGKSTLLNIIAGLDGADFGRIERCPDQRLSFVFQEPRLLPWRSVADNLRLVLTNGDGAVDHWLEAVGLAEARDVFASRLSLGMARRAAIARAFIVNPGLLLMDEPFVSLDAATSLRLQSLLLELLARERTSLLFVTHDLREAIRICDRMVFLSPAPSKIVFECAIPLSQDERQQERVIDQKREAIIGEFGLDAGRLEFSGQQPNAG